MDNALAETIGEHTGQIEGLMRWQKQQNGTLQKIEGRLRRLELILAALVILDLLTKAGNALAAIAAVLHGFGF